MSNTRILAQLCERLQAMPTRNLISVFYICALRKIPSCLHPPKQGFFTYNQHVIGKIRGTLAEIDGADGLVETASGVFYRVCLTHTLLTLPLPQEVELYTYHQVREDAQVLYAFATLEEYRAFVLLLAVDGVGPKTAHLVVSTRSPRELYDAVRANDMGAFKRIPGLGTKTAQKIILELSNKFKTGFCFEKVKETEVDDEAVLALMALGYTKADARKMLENVDPKLSMQDKIQRALTRTEEQGDHRLRVSRPQEQL